MNAVSKRFPVRRSWLDTVRHPWKTEWTPILQSVTCDIELGEFFGVLGPNGAGKTTLFRILASTILPDSGTANVLGVDVRREARATREVLAAVPAEERSLNWRLSARENLYLFGRLHGLKGAALRKRVDELLEIVGLTEPGERMVSKYSSGMKQRLMIARALLGHPRVLLLDEPTRALDPIGARQLRAFLRTELVEKQGCTVVLATHNSEEALDLCDRVAVMDRGRMLAVGSASVLAHEILGERYRVWTRNPGHPVWSDLARERLLVPVESTESANAEWAAVEFTILGGRDAASAILARLSAAGVPMSGFLPVQTSLADLIEQIVHRSKTDNR